MAERSAGSYCPIANRFMHFLEKQGLTTIHPLGDLKINLSYFRELNTAVGNGSFLSPHNKKLSRQTHQNNRRDREIEFLRDELFKAKKAMRYKDHVMQKLVDAKEDSDLYHRSITPGEERRLFNLLRGAIGFRGPAYIDKPWNRGNVRTLDPEDSKGRANEGLRAVGNTGLAASKARKAHR